VKEYNHFFFKKPFSLEFCWRPPWTSSGRLTDSRWRPTYFGFQWKYGDIQQKSGVSNEKLGGLYTRIWGSPTRRLQGSPIEIQWWWFLPRLLKRYTHEKRSRLKNNQCSLRTWNPAICNNLDAIGKALQFLYYFIHCKWSKGVTFVE